MLTLALAACDLPPGFNEVDPDDVDRRDVGTADFSPVPNIRGSAQVAEVWNTDFVAWQFGGRLNCVGTTPGPGTPGTPGTPGNPGNQVPTVVEIWDGLTDPCTEDPTEGTRVLRIETSDFVAGTYTIAQQCIVPQIARVFFGEVRGGALFLLEAVEGSVTLTGLDSNDVLEGAFSVRFDQAGLTSGGFRGGASCLDDSLFDDSEGFRLQSEPSAG